MTGIPAIGIDLGTTFSCVSHYKNGRPELIINNEGDRLTPSVVYFDPKDGRAIVGRIAYDLSAQCLGNFLLDAKRFIGRRYEDEHISKYISANQENNQQTYSLVRAPDGQVGFEIEIKKKKIIKKPEEVSAEVLKYLKEAAGVFLNENVTKAVISVPAYFSNAQRKATKRAAELAGLEVLRLVTEPTAAAVYYTSEKEKTNSNILTFDFGGGTLDVSLIKVKDSVFEVKAVYGDTLLGGRDIDNNLYQHFYKKIFNTRKKRKKLTNWSKQQLHNMCITLKKNLSIREEFTTILERFFEDSNFEISISRNEFEEINQVIFKPIMDIVDLCLEEAAMSKSDINELILVGGSTRIPKIKNMLASSFGSAKIKTDLNPDEAVAAGASIYAAFTLGGRNLEKYEVTDVTPLSLGIGLAGNRMLTVIPRNSPIPYKATRTTVTAVNDQTETLFEIFEGERKIVSYSNKIGQITITDLPKKRAGDIKFLITFCLDENGILSVTVTETSTSNSVKIEITMGHIGLNDKKTKSCLQDAKKYKINDEVFEKFTRFKAKVDRYFLQVLYDIKKISSVKDQDYVKLRCEAFLSVSDAVDFTDIESLETIFIIYKQSISDILQRNLTLELKYDVNV